MPPALQWNGQQTSLLTDPGSCCAGTGSRVVAPPGSLHVAGAGASSFQHLPLPSIWTLLLLAHQDAKVTEGSRCHLVLVLFSFLK